MATGIGRGRGRDCVTCLHPRRAEIEQDLCLDPNARVIAARYGLSKSAVDRHHQKNHGGLSKEERAIARLAAINRHLAETRAMAPEIEAREAEREAQLAALRAEVQQIRATRRGILDQWKQLEAANKLVWEVLAKLRDEKIPAGESRLERFDRVLKAVQRVEGQIELQAKFLGDITEGVNNVVNVNFATSPEWLQLEAGLVEAVRGCQRCAPRVQAAAARLEGPE